MGNALNKWLHSSSLDEWTTACKYLSVDELDPTPVTPDTEGQITEQEGYGARNGSQECIYSSD